MVCVWMASAPVMLGGVAQPAQCVYVLKAVQEMVNVILRNTGASVTLVTQVGTRGCLMGTGS